MPVTTNKIIFSLVKILFLLTAIVTSAKNFAANPYGIDTITVNNITDGSKSGTVNFDMVFDGQVMLGHYFEFKINHTKVTGGTPGSPTASFSFDDHGCNGSIYGTSFSYDNTNLKPVWGTGLNGSSCAHGTVTVSIKNMEVTSSWSGGNISCSFVLDEGPTFTCPTIYFPPVTTGTCHTSQQSADVDMGDWFISDFTGVGSSTNKRDLIMNLDCDPGVSVDIKVAATEDTSYKQNFIAIDSGGASGVAIKLTDQNNQKIQLNTQFNVIASTNEGQNTIHWYAQYVQSADTITEGQANAMATMKFFYN